MFVLLSIFLFKDVDMKAHKPAACHRILVAIDEINTNTEV